MALAFVTAAVTTTPEMAQVTTLPGFAALFGGGFLTMADPPGEVTWWMVAVPGGAVAQLVRLGWDGAGITVATVGPAVVATLVVTTVTVWFARRAFRWQPRG